MADISMSRSHDLGTDEVQKRIEELAGRLSERLGGSWCWQGSQAVCSARGAKARVGYDDRSISMEVDLPFVLRPMRGRIESKIEEYFERYFREGSER